MLLLSTEREKSELTRPAGFTVEIFKQMTFKTFSEHTVDMRNTTMDINEPVAPPTGPISRGGVVDEVPKFEGGGGGS